MRRSVLLLAAVATAVLLASGAALAVTSTGTPHSGAKAKGPGAALDGALRALVARRGGPPGAIAIVQRGADREVHAFGVRNLKSGQPMRAGDRTRIASAAKAFSGAAALSLVSRGRLSLGDTIGERLPELPEAWHKVTLRQLLEHTSGIPDFSLTGGYREAVFASLEKAPPPEKLLTYAYGENLLFEPGSRYHYSNSDNIAVGLMVESATGKSYERELWERVYAPLGLKKTTLPKGANLRAPYTHGYDND